MTPGEFPALQPAITRLLVFFSAVPLGVRFIVIVYQEVFIQLVFAAAPNRPHDYSGDGSPAGFRRESGVKKQAAHEGAGGLRLVCLCHFLSGAGRPVFLRSYDARGIPSSHKPV